MKLNRLLFIAVLSIASAVACQPQGAKSRANRAGSTSFVMNGTPATALDGGMTEPTTASNSATSFGADSPIVGAADPGDWNSGGGYAPNDQFNPWFVKNTKTVRYCIEIDEKNFGLDLSTARKGIIGAIAYWKKEFELSRLGLHHPDENKDYDYSVFLGTQDFVEDQTCGAQTDLTIQLGFLKPEQLKKIAKPENYLALTVRNYYDPVNLKGRGFMYFSPVRGPLTPNSKDANEQRWSMGDAANFRIMAAHEFGHVFGASNSDHFLMKSNIMNYLVSVDVGTKEAVKKFDLMAYLQSDLYPKESRDTCAWENSEGFPLPGLGKTKCIRMNLDTTYDSGIERYTIEFLAGTKEKLAPYALFTTSNSGSSTSMKYYGSMYLDAQQKVFKPKTKASFIDTQAMLAQRTVEGKMLLRTGEELATTMTIEGGGRILFTIHKWKDIPELADHEWFFRFHQHDANYRKF